MKSIEEIEALAEPLLEELDNSTDSFLSEVSNLAIGLSSVAELDNSYKNLKDIAKQLNKLAKELRKIKEKSDENNQAQ